MKTRVYDLPTRLFHGVFAASFVAAFAIANGVDDESQRFAYHMLAGLLMLFVLAWRLVWGLIGSRHARFTDFQLNPAALLRYLAGVFSGQTTNGHPSNEQTTSEQKTREQKHKWAGHNPASSWAAIAMFALAIGLGVTGYLMASGDAEAYEDLHELFANSFFVVVLLHIAGVVLHQLKHRDQLGLSMLTGNKQQLDQTATPVRSHTLVAILMLVATLWFGRYLLQQFDANSGTLQLFGTTLQLTEQEGGESGEGGEQDDDD